MKQVVATKAWTRTATARGAGSLMGELMDKHMALATGRPFPFERFLLISTALSVLTTVTTFSWRHLRLGLLGQLSDLMNQDKAMIGAVPEG